MDQNERTKKEEDRAMALAEMGVAFRNVADAIDAVGNGTMPPEQVTTSLEIIRDALTDYLVEAQLLEATAAEASGVRRSISTIPPHLN
jgi:hypothetical protein